MKKSLLVTMLLFLCMYSCTPPSQKAAAGANDTVKTVQVIFIPDISGSCYDKYTHPDPALFKPMCDRIAENNTLDFRVCIIEANSDKMCARYYALYVPKPTEDTNPWMDKEKPKEVQPAANWADFAATINNKLAAGPAQASDIASAITHAIVSFEENTAPTRKILIIATDYKDSFSEIPGVPHDIEVISIGALTDIPVEEILHTKVKRFESLEAAIDYVSNQFN